MKFETEWKDRAEVRFSKGKLSYPAHYSLIHFFYSDRLEIAVDDMEDLVRICKVCNCESLQKVLEKELNHQRFSDYKSLREIESSQRRFILQSSSLPELDRLPAALHVFFRFVYKIPVWSRIWIIDMWKILLTFALKHTDGLRDIDPEQVEEMFDAASRYFLLPLKRAVADALLPHLEMASPVEVCHWLLLADMYDVVKIREYCLDIIAWNFEAFSDTREFRAMLLTLPRPLGIHPSAQPPQVHQEQKGAPTRLICLMICVRNG
ncbi:BTB/POZ domain-containing protein [Drosera capensis]